MAALSDSGWAPIWRMPVERYHAMIQSGILGPDDRVELLDGVIVQKMSKNPPHRIAALVTSQALARAVPDGWYVDREAPITLAGSEPEPDVAVIRGDTRDYRAAHPGPAETGLVVEISDATLDRDRFLKRRIYASAGIPFYWILDLVNRRLEAHSEPRSGDYSHCVVYRPEDSAPLVLDGQQIASIPVSTLLP